MSGNNGTKPEYEEIELDLPALTRVLNENGITTTEDEVIDRFSSTFLNLPALAFRIVVPREDKPTLLVTVPHTAIADAIYNRRKKDAEPGSQN